MYDPSISYVIVIQISSTFVALMSGFAVSRYFSNYSELQKLSYERRLNSPQLEKLQELVRSQKELREGTETTRLHMETLQILNSTLNISNDELINKLDSNLELDATRELVEYVRFQRNQADDTILKKVVGALIPSPSEEQLKSLGIEFDETNRFIYIDALGRYRDEKRRLLSIDNPLKINFGNWDALSRNRFGLIPSMISLHSGRTEAQNNETLLELLHTDKLLEAEIKVRERAMQMKYYFLTTITSSFMGILVPTFFLMRRPIMDTAFSRGYLVFATFVTVASAIVYVLKAVQRANK